MRNLRFRNTYQRMPRAKRINVRNSIMNECQVSIGCFYNWYNCLTRIPDHQKTIIARIMQIETPELFPEHETISI